MGVESEMERRSLEPSILCADEAIAASFFAEHLARNAIWNLVGYAAPLIVAVLVIPLLIKQLGTTRYGVLSIAWGVVGYFGVFDMGLSNALTKFVAERVGKVPQEQINAIIHTGFVLLLCSSLSAGIILAIISRPLSYTWLNVPQPLREQTCTVFRLFAVALPFVVSLACFRGTLGAYGRFDLINKVQIATGVLSFGLPALVALFSRDLPRIVTAITLCRVGGWLVYLRLCMRVVPGLDFRWRARRMWVRPLTTFGGWMSVCNITDPLFLYSDRLILGALMSVGMVAYYATPFDTIIRLWIIPDALNSAAFPAYAGGLKDDRDRVLMLLERVAHYIFPLILPLVLLVVSFSREILTVWISAPFATHSATVLAWLAIGVFFSSMGRIPWTLLISCRPDLPAKLVLFEAPLYVSILYVMIGHWGLEGAAMAWTLRSTFNCSMVHALTWWTLPGSSRTIRQNLGLL